MKLFVDILVLLPALLLFDLPVVASESGTLLDKNEDSPAGTLRGERQLKKKGNKVYGITPNKGSAGKTNKGYKGSTSGAGKTNKGTSGYKGNKAGKDRGFGVGGGGKQGGGNQKGGNKAGKRTEPSNFGNNFATNLYPCISPDEGGIRQKADLPMSEAGCLNGACGGCCRDYSYLICDETGQMPYMRCICGTGSFANEAVSNVGGGSGSGISIAATGGSNFQVAGSGGGTAVNVGSTTVTYGGNPGTNSNGAYVGQIQVYSPP